MFLEISDTVQSQRPQKYFKWNVLTEQLKIKAIHSSAKNKKQKSVEFGKSEEGF